MKYSKKEKKELDSNTKQYVRRIRNLQLILFVVMCGAFMLFANEVAVNNRQSMRSVALAEVEESMQETINNLAIHIDNVRERIGKEAAIYIEDTALRMKKSRIEKLEDVLFQIEVSEENKLGLAVQVIYVTSNQEYYHVASYDRQVTLIKESEIEALYQNIGAKAGFEIGDQEIVLFITQSDIDELVKSEIREYIHSEKYEGNQYVWVNEVLNMEGGDDYAIRRIHPNLVESEGQYLSTSMQDVVGNYPYLAELEGIRTEGKILHSYYFKNILNDEITEKFSYSQYYEPFCWILSTGETLKEVYEYSVDLNNHDLKQIVMLMVIFVGIFILIFGVIANILGKQAQDFRETLLKQNEIFENIYMTMPVGLLRIKIRDDNAEMIKINPKGLKLFGVESEEEFLAREKNQVVDTMNQADATALMMETKKLVKQWDNVSVECYVRWKDDSLHLLRIRNTLVDFEGDAKIVQRMCQDITEERKKQEKELKAAEEKATLDPMTQIKNKKALEAIMKIRVKEAAEQNIAIAIGFMDIDNFRVYNTLYGHMQGDEVIKYVANVLRENVRGDVGRMGGDEFAFCMLNTSYQEVDNIMKEIHKKLNEGIVVKQTGEKIPTPCSIGIVIEQSQDINYEYMIERSDQAMYYAKEKGKNTYHILM